MGQIVKPLLRRRSFFFYRFLGTFGASSGIIYFSIKREKCLINDTKPPQRVTEQYVCGQNLGQFQKNTRPLRQQAVFILYLMYRILTLFMHCIPLLWFAVLTYKFGLCPEEFFSCQLLKFFTHMGPTYMKLGQWMATRPDVFPPNLCKSLECLFDSVDPHHWKHTKNVLEKSFVVARQKSLDSDSSKKESKRPVIDFLCDIEQDTINSGSIAQIHRAKLKESIDNVPQGTELALKVVHPGIRKTFAADLASMKLFVQLFDILFPDARLFNFKISLREFESLVLSQLDLRIERDNLLQFIYNFRYFSGVIFPTPLPSLVSEDVLVETFEDGVPLTRITYSEANRDLAEIGCRMLMKMLFEDNFVHSDLHPGNILVRTNGDDSCMQGGNHFLRGKPKQRRELIILDAGLAMSLSERNRHNFISLFAAVACGEGELGASLMLERFPSVENSSFCSNSINTQKFRSDMKKVFDQVSHTSGFKLSNIQIGKVLLDILSTLRENKAPLDGSFSSLVLTVVVGEGLGRKLAPDFNLFAEASPYLISYLESKQLLSLSEKLAEKYCDGCSLQKHFLTGVWKKIKTLLKESLLVLRSQTGKFME